MPHPKSETKRRSGQGEQEGEKRRIVFASLQNKQTKHKKSRTQGRGPVGRPSQSLEGEGGSAGAREEVEDVARRRVGLQRLRTCACVCVNEEQGMERKTVVAPSASKQHNPQSASSVISLLRNHDVTLVHLFPPHTPAHLPFGKPREDGSPERGRTGAEGGGRRGVIETGRGGNMRDAHELRRKRKVLLAERQEKKGLQARSGKTAKDSVISDKKDSANPRDL